MKAVTSDCSAATSVVMVAMSAKTVVVLRRWRGEAETMVRPKKLATTFEKSILKCRLVIFLCLRMMYYRGAVLLSVEVVER